MCAPIKYSLANMIVSLQAQPPPDCQTNDNQQEAHDNNLTQLKDTQMTTCSNFTVKDGANKSKSLSVMVLNVVQWTPSTPEMRTPL